MNLDGWTRVGPAGRRSLWCRINPKPGAEQSAGGFLAEPENVESINLCAGREGDDAELTIDASNPQFAAILDVILCAEYAAELADGDQW